MYHYLLSYFKLFNPLYHKIPEMLFGDRYFLNDYSEVYDMDTWKRVLDLSEIIVFGFFYYFFYSIQWNPVQCMVPIEYNNFSVSRCGNEIWYHSHYFVMLSAALTVTSGAFGALQTNSTLAKAADKGVPVPNTG